MAIIEVENLEKIYGKLKAVDDVSFSVKGGETFGILGPNGAGKTTTLEILEGLRNPTKGKAFIDKLSIKKDKDKIKEIMGVQLQSSAFFDYLTVKEILTLFADLYANPADIDEILYSVQLKAKEKSYADKLSGGQRQRLSIASALVNNPRIVFLDEPTTGLDPQARRKLWSLIKQIQKKGQTIVLTTHYMEEAEKLCDRVAIMDRGKIVALDSPTGLIKSSKVKTKIRFRTVKKIPDNLAALCKGRVDKNHGVVIETKDPERSLHELMECVEEHKIEIVDLVVQKPSLEDVFLELTGRKLRE